MKRYTQSSDIASIAFIIAILALIIAVVSGWIMNIVTLIGMVDTNVAVNSAGFVLRVIGIFVAPLGVVLGYL